VRSRRTAAVGPRPRLAKDLSRDHHLFAFDLEVFQGLTGDGFRDTTGVNIGGIDEVDSCFEGASDQPLGFLLL